MIAVIADDFTGAAELAGIGLRYNLTVELGTEVNAATKADLFVIATDARSLPEVEAVAIMQKHTRELLAMQPAMIFKKTDSVLRGHVLAELQAQLSLTGFKKAVLVAANPALGRTIADGQYFLHGKPVHESSFSHDPDFAISSSTILEMLRSDGELVYVKKYSEVLPDAGIIVGEAVQTADLQAWATRMDKTTLIAGASGFFTAMLDKMLAGKQPAKSVEIPERLPFSLFVCGTTFSQSRNTIKSIKAAGGPVCYMPEEIIRSVHSGTYSFVKWANEVVALVKNNEKAIVAIHEDSTRNTAVGAGQLKEKMAGLVNEVLQRSMVQELIVEGGATAWALISQSKLTRFYPVEEMAPGVVRMQTNDPNLFITVKPGSYQWPDGLWDF
ncbi:MULTISPECIES: four-carbon acid sugar kinase family protein [Niastella]|uniref:Four-carbon acid sugar kinase family protein n=1 Tax=Niastella soli TaxID=2821487 RepID=A0ABS3Z1L6_9BACT|nr:four-carbon acid sugar kinase family protein [Niastella soli]MBO9204061.1 four-carbon acid sugar kinase family protein [Niastella soli]